MRTVNRTMGLAVVYAALLAYGTLYPLWEWRWPPGGVWPLPSWPEQVSRSDVLTNVFVYLPFGLLWGRVFRRRFRGVMCLAAVGVFGGGYSLGLECLQAFVPGRVPSLLDVALNGAGSVGGAAVAALFGPGIGQGQWFGAVRRRWFLPGQVVSVALAVPALWGLEQLFPLVPSLDVGGLRAGLRPLYHAVVGTEVFSPSAAVVYACQVAGLGLFVSLLARSVERVRWIFAGFVMAVLALKVPVVGRQLSLEAVAGTAAGCGLLFLVGRGRYRVRAIVAAGFLVAAVCVDGLRPGQGGGGVAAMVWVPFQAHMASFLGLVDVISGAWPWFALGWLGRIGAAPGRRGSLATIGAAGVAVGTLAIEFAQRGIPGRTPDITDMVIATVAWALPWWLVRDDPVERVAEEGMSARQPAVMDWYGQDLG